MSSTLNQMEQKIVEIERLVDPRSKRYGRLLNWQNFPDPFWHYGIGLSDTHIFDTGQGLQPFERRDTKFVVGIDHIAFEPRQVIERLKHALYVISDWKYTLLGWNCEHLGRLIATDEPRCHQSKLIWWLSDLTPEGDHKAAYQILRDYLEKTGPGLNR